MYIIWNAWEEGRWVGSVKNQRRLIAPSSIRSDFIISTILNMDCEAFWLIISFGRLSSVFYLAQKLKWKELQAQVHSTPLRALSTFLTHYAVPASYLRLLRFFTRKGDFLWHGIPSHPVSNMVNLKKTVKCTENCTKYIRFSFSIPWLTSSKCIM